MAKKVRRVRRPPVEETAAVVVPARPAPSHEEELREAYAYVLRDLRRVFILAVAMFLLLIILNLVL
ncbi:MAG: hypothetical protein L0332_35395 [Chloroflexi bacterium]|nr:hypothetical protein [Chloroflexota bacterium]MCI0644810.1 hypothetical protein [Chloroflexota bacterium]MCI0731985.1 hypothetical protein [Chloroflexota bacterium]